MTHEEAAAAGWEPAIGAVYGTATGRPQRFDLFGAFATEAERDEWLARFPKGAKVRAGTLGTGDPGARYPEPGYRVILPTITATVKLSADDVNRGVNETGLRRVRAILKIEGLRWKATFSNSYATREAFIAAIEEVRP